MFKTLFLFTICVLTTGALAQNPGADLSNFGIRIEPDKRVMAVLATLEAARTTDASGESVPVIKTPLSAEGEKFRDLLRSDLAALPADLRQKISTFLIAHKKRYPNQTDAELVAPFISMAYALTPAPELADPVVTIDLPGNLLDVLDFAPLVREFYRRSSFSSNVNDYVKTYQKAAANGGLTTSASEMASEILSYLNTRPQATVVEKVRTETQRSKSKKTLKAVEIRERERSFTLVPELLAPRDTVNFVNVKDEYYVVLPAELPVNRELSFSEARRGFLQFVVDPLIYGNGKDVDTIRPLVKQLLDERRKVDPTVSPDVYLTLSRSLVAAIDARQTEFTRVNALTAQTRQRINAARTDEEKRALVQGLEKTKAELADETALRLSEDYEKGALLDFYFADQLRGFEGSGFDIASSMKDMMLGFDGIKEADRLGQAAEARKRAAALRGERKKSLQSASVLVENPVVNQLLAIQETIKAGDYTRASAELKKLRNANPKEPRIAYNQGRVASLTAEHIDDEEELKAKLKEAKDNYEAVLSIAIEKKAAYDKLRTSPQQNALAIQLAEGELVDPALLSLTYVALGKIYEFFDEKAFALRMYDLAIVQGKVAGGALNEAIAGKARLSKEQ